MARRRKKSVSPWLIVGIVFGVLGIIGLGCCGGLYFFYSKLTSPTSYPAETEPYHVARSKFKPDSSHAAPHHRSTIRFDGRSASTNCLIAPAI